MCVSVGKSIKGCRSSLWVSSVYPSLSLSYGDQLYCSLRMFSPYQTEDNAFKTNNDVRTFQADGRPCATWIQEKSASKSSFCVLKENRFVVRNRVGKTNSGISIHFRGLGSFWKAAKISVKERDAVDGSRAVGDGNVP